MKHVNFLFLLLLFSSTMFASIGNDEIKEFIIKNKKDLNIIERHVLDLDSKINKLEHKIVLLEEIIKSTQERTSLRKEKMKTMTNNSKLESNYILTNNNKINNTESFTEKSNYMVKTWRANVRKSPSSSSKIIDILKAGKQVAIIETGKYWYKTDDYNFVTKDALKKINLERKKVSYDTNIYSEPLNSSEIVGLIKMGEEVDVYGKVVNDEWVCIGESKFIFASSIKE